MSKEDYGLSKKEYVSCCLSVFGLLLALPFLKIADFIFPARRRYSKYLRLESQAWRAFRKGNFEKAEALATTYLHVAPQYVNDWNYGNAIHEGHQILGLVRLRAGDIGQAKRHLRLAGKTRGSPQLGTGALKMVLARELLEHGEREAVLEYLRLVRRFWPAANYPPALLASNKKLLEQWRQEIADGKIPQHSMWYYRMGR